MKAVSMQACCAKQSCTVQIAPTSGSPRACVSPAAQVVGEFGLGEFVNRFQRGSLVMKLPDTEAARIPTVLFGTVNGAIGVVASLPKERFEFLWRLQARPLARVPAGSRLYGGPGILRACVCGGMQDPCSGTQLSDRRLCPARSLLLHQVQGVERLPACRHVLSKGRLCIMCCCRVAACLSAPGSMLWVPLCLRPSDPHSQY